MKSLAGKIFFYLVTSIPAYILIYLGLAGIGVIQPYSYYYNAQPIGFLNYVPTQQFALYFILTGSGILFGMILHLIKKFNEPAFDELVDFLKLRSGMHTHHCEISSLGTYLGIGALVAVIIMYFVLQISILSNLIILFAIALSSGIGAVIYYRYDNGKSPFG